MSVFLSACDDVYLSELNIVGTHDSATAFVNMENMARCQSLTIKQQLDIGVRIFDIRLHKKGREFYLVHSLANCYSDSEKRNKLTFGEVLCDFMEFLEENPEETLIVSVKQDRGIMSRLFFPAFYDKYIKGSEGKWYLKNENPTLSQCRGKMVLMRRCKVFKKYLKRFHAGLDFSFWPDQGGKRKVKPEVVVLSGDKHRSKNAWLTAVVQDRYCLEAEEKWEKCAKPALDSAFTDENNISVHFLSTSIRKDNQGLDKTAEIVNRYFKEYPLKKGSGWLLFDFPDGEIAEKVITSNL